MPHAAALAADLSDGTLDSNHQMVSLALTGKTVAGADVVATAIMDMFMTGQKSARFAGNVVRKCADFGTFRRQPLSIWNRIESCSCRRYGILGQGKSLPQERRLTLTNK